MTDLFLIEHPVFCDYDSIPQWKAFYCVFAFQNERVLSTFFSIGQYVNNLFSVDGASYIIWWFAVSLNRICIYFGNDFRRHRNQLTHTSLYSLLLHSTLSKHHFHCSLFLFRNRLSDPHSNELRVEQISLLFSLCRLFFFWFNSYWHKMLFN